MTNKTQNAVSTPAIETKISANGNVNIYVNGKRVSNDKAVEVACENNLPVYCASCLTYTDRFVNETFASPISAYRWLQVKCNSNRNFADGNREIEEVDKVNGRRTTIYESTENHFAVNNAELEAHILTLNNCDAEEIKAMIKKLADAVKYESYKLTPEYQIEMQKRAEREAAEAQEKANWEAAKHLAAKIAVDSKSVDDNFRFAIYNFVGMEVQYALAESREDDNTDVFDLLPTVDELNDVDTDEVKTTSELVAEMNAKIDRIIAEFDREQAEAQKSVALAELKAAIDNVPLPGKDVELWKERNKVAAEINKLYKIEELLTVDEFNAKLRILQEKLKDVDEQITACQNADKEPKIPAAELKAKYDACDDEDERVNIAIEAYRNYIEPYIEPKIKQQKCQIAEQVCASLTADAPHGWAVTFTDEGRYKVSNNGLSAATLDTITVGDFINPKEFFAKFNPTQEQIDDERESLLRQLYNERDQLLNMRADLVKDFPNEKERLKILDDMLHENDLSITALESLCTRPGMVKSNPKELWF